MYDRVLIHADSRKAFETHLPFLEGVLRRKIAKEVVLTTVVRPCEPTLFGYVIDPADVAGIDAHNLAEANEFVQRMARKLEADGIPLQTQVLMGDPNEAFRTYATQGGFDLVIIAPTGRRYLLTGKARAFRRELRRLAKPIMILPAVRLPARAT